MRRSRIYDFNDDEFSLIVTTSISMSQVMRRIGLPEKGSNRKTAKKRIASLNLDTSHFRNGNFGTAPPNKIPLEEILVEGSTYQTGKLKKRLLKIGLLDEVCSICGQGPTWKEQRLVLILDHINGNSLDHRIENLRIVCPNCDTQLPTFKGRNKST